MLLAVLLLFPTLTLQFYVPGMAPTDFKKGQQIEVKAVKMTSIHTQLPYEYYSLPFCLPKNGSNSIHYKSENLGEVCISRQLDFLLFGKKYTVLSSFYIKEF